MKIAARLALGFGFLLLLIASFGGYAIHHGEAMMSGTTDLSRKADNKYNVTKLQKLMFQSRMNLWSGVATLSTEKFQKAEELLNQTKKATSDLIETIKDPERRKLIEPFPKKIDEYLSVTKKVRDLSLQGFTVGNKEIDEALAEGGKIGASIDENSDELNKAIIKTEEEYRKSYNEMTSSFMKFSIIFNIVSIILGVGFGLVIFRSIAPPIKAMTRAMEALAKGDLSVVIPATSNKDEIGDMAKAVQVFKDNALQVEKLKREQVEAEAKAAAERKKALHQMADQFEASVMGVVKVVSSSATEMQATAQSMSAGAQQASDRAATVAAAATETTANVQTVASAAEELSSSISEIGSRVAEKRPNSRCRVRQGRIYQ